MRCAAASCRSLVLVLLAGAALGAGYATQPPAEGDRPRQFPTERRPSEQGGQPGQPGGGQPGQRPEPRNVEGAMKMVNRALRQLNAQLGDEAKKNDNLRLVGDAQRGAVLAKSMEPRDTPEDGRADYLKKFRLGQIELLGDLLELEMNILNDKHDDARAMMDKLARLRDESHKDFGVEDDGDGKGWEGGRRPGPRGERPDGGPDGGRPAPRGN